MAKRVSTYVDIGTTWYNNPSGVRFTNYSKCTKIATWKQTKQGHDSWHIMIHDCHSKSAKCWTPSRMSHLPLFKHDKCKFAGRRVTKRPQGFGITGGCHWKACREVLNQKPHTTPRSCVGVGSGARAKCLNSRFNRSCSPGSSNHIQAGTM